jgi:hypothetical protein
MTAVVETISHSFFIEPQGENNANRDCFDLAQAQLAVTLCTRALGCLIRHNRPRRTRRGDANVVIISADYLQFQRFGGAMVVTVSFDALLETLGESKGNGNRFDHTQTALLFLRRPTALCRQSGRKGPEMCLV